MTASESIKSHIKLEPKADNCDNPGDEVSLLGRLNFLVVGCSINTSSGLPMQKDNTVSNNFYLMSIGTTLFHERSVQL